jgi:hypothetical protein
LKYRRPNEAEIYGAVATSWAEVAGVVSGKPNQLLSTWLGVGPNTVIWMVQYRPTNQKWGLLIFQTFLGPDSS